MYIAYMVVMTVLAISLLGYAVRLIQQRGK